MVKEKHFYKSKDWFVFPLAIEWAEDMFLSTKKQYRLVLHFLWWHWKWTFLKGDR